VESQPKPFRATLSTRLGVALLFGMLLGGAAVYVSSHLGSSRPARSNARLSTALRDDRTPENAYYRPFIGGFVVGALLGFITAGSLGNPTAKRPGRH
jgi:uncharacterized membrane protein YfcA